MICRTCEQNKDPETEFRSTYTRKKDGKKSYRPVCEKCDGKARPKRKYITRWAGAENQQKQYGQTQSEKRRLGLERDRWILNDSRRWDKKHGFQNDLTRGFILQQIASGCSYCGETSLKIGLDRVDNTKGHTQNNVRAACVRCNYLRRDMPFDAWMVLVPSIRAAKEAGLFGTWAALSFRERGRQKLER